MCPRGVLHVTYALSVQFVQKLFEWVPYMLLAARNVMDTLWNARLICRNNWIARVSYISDIPQSLLHSYDSPAAVLSASYCTLPYGRQAVEPGKSMRRGRQTKRESKLVVRSRIWSDRSGYFRTYPNIMWCSWESSCSSSAAQGAFKNLWCYAKFEV